MTLTDTLILGLIQGITEFLPISSSGHLVIGTAILGITEPSLAFDVLLHFGSLLSILIYFRQRLLSIDRITLKYIGIATIPIVIIGLIMRPHAESMFQNLGLAGVGLIITSLLLFSTKYIRNKVTDTKMSTQKAILIGISQALAIFPGISRSGSTVSTGLFLGLDRKRAFELSFFLAIPAISGAMLLHLPQLNQLSPQDYPSYILGFSVSAITGVLSLGVLEKVINQAKLHWFGLYCFVLGMLTLSWHFIS